MRRLVFDHPWIDQARAPVYVMRLPAERTHERLRAMCRHITETYRSITDPEPFGWLNVTDYSKGSDAIGRQIMAEHLREVESQNAARVVSQVTVVRPAEAPKDRR